MATNGAIAAILAAQAAAQRRALEAFRVAGATAPERAQSLQALDIPESMALRALTNRGIVREAGAGLFWLDEKKAHEQSRAGKPLVFAIIVLLLILAAGLAMMMGTRIR